MTRRFVLSVLLLVGAFAAPAGAAAPGSGEGGAPFLDVRDGVRAEAVAERRNAPDAPAGQERAADGLVAGQGPQATLELDPTTGTVRSLADLSGALTGPSGGDPRDIALSYVRAHRVALGLTEADLATLRPAGEDVSPEGLVVVRWRQQTGGISVFDNGLVVTLDHAGRVLSVGGAPLHEPDPNASAPDLSADQALAQLRDSVGDSSGTETAAPQRTYFDVNGALRLAWHLQYRASSTALYDAVVDATSGRVLYRANLVRFAVNVNVFPHYPGAQFGGTQQSVDLSSYLSTTGSLSGPNAVAYADLNDDDSNNGGAESVNPSTATSTFNATYSLQSHGHCASSVPCSWDHTVASSWQTNKAQDAIQAFWFVNVYHDHLAAAPIGFTTASGAFEDDDRLVVNTDDGANGTGGVPSSGHRNNANMSTPPDGSSPQMQMYLFGNSSSFRDVNGGDTAEIVFHEYTHGLTSRLVHDASGAEALDSAQSGAMGEAWSDWYAMDFLNRGDAPPSGLGAVMVPDTPTPGEVDMGAYTDAVPNSIRSQPLDCPVGASATLCPGGGTAGSGGYTYGDFGKICGCGPEVHADGEIWSETLWDLRSALIDHFGSTTQGSDAAEQLVTGALRLSPPEPTFLDMRNAILLADNNLGAPYRSIIWDVFAHRGMGFFAGVTDGSDINPAEDFNGPPAAGGPTGTLAGTVKDAITGKPIAGVTVSIGGHSSGVSVFTATTGSDGHYSMSGVPAGTYGKVFVTAGSGYDASVRRNVAVSGATTLDFPLHHNWAASDSGGAIASTNDNYYGEAPNDYGCGTAAIIDGLQGNGWSAWRPATDNDYPSTLSGNPPTATIALPRTIDISGFAGDPSATCGDDITATTKTFTIETSPDDATWTMAYDGRSASTDFDVSDAGTMKALAPTGGTSRVRYVRVTLLSPQSISSSDDGFEFIDFSEFAVYGNPVPTAALSVPSAATAGDTVALDASGSSDDSAIVSYGWDFDGNGSVDATTGGPVVNHVYDQPGTFAPRVTVTDDGGSTAVASGSIAVSAGQTSSSGQTTPPSGETTPPSGETTPPSGETTPPPGQTTPPSGETTPPPGQTTPAPEQTTPQPAAPGLPRLALLAGARITGVSLRLACAVSCGGTATLTVSAKVARRLGLRFRTISRVTIKALQGTRTLRIAVKRSVLALLRAHRVRSLRPTLHGAVTDRLGRHARLTGTPLVRITPR